MLFFLLRNRSISRITFDPLCISIELYSKYNIHARASVARSRGLPSELSARAREEGKEKAKECSRRRERRRGGGGLATTSYTYEIIYYLERGVIWCGHWIAKVAVKSWRRKEDGRKVGRQRWSGTEWQIER